MTPGLATYWHTLRHLKAVQLYGRAWFRVVTPSVNARAAPPQRRRWSGVWVLPARRRPRLLEPDRFCFLNNARALAHHGWDDPALEKLWRYNLHYFDDLNAYGAPERKGWHLILLARWVRENAPARGTGWEPYPTSLRIINWIKWALAGNELPAECVQSLAVQARWLSKRLEFHLLGNHLMANAKALLFAGVFFDGAEADAWRNEGLRLLQREVAEQILSDGGHFERSTMYHALALEDMLDLCNVTQTFADALPAEWDSIVENWRRRTGPMREWLAAMCHPDGEIAFFNDAAMNIAATRCELDSYAERLGLSPRVDCVQGVTTLSATGYIRVAVDEAVAILDVAPVGPDYLPAHAHADTLSFELSLFGSRVFVNSGTSCYGNSAERLRQRGTAAHNTVIVDGLDSSEVWGGFRVARRARPFGLEVTQYGPIQVRCSHDGYRRLKGRPVHERQWQFGARELILEDRVSGSFDRAEARFHLHPSIVLVESAADAAGAVVLQTGDAQRIRVCVEGGDLQAKAATWHPEFGRSEPNLCLVAKFDGALLRTRISWQAER